MPNDTYKSVIDAVSNSRVGKQVSKRAEEFAYNPKAGKWEPVSVSNNSDDTSLSTSVENGGSVTVDSSSKVNSKAQADSEYIEIEFNTLEGELNLIASKKTIAIKVGQTIKIEGVGKYLSGLYYVSAVKRTIDNSQGYSHSLTVIKTGFGSSLKQVQVTQTEAERPKEVETKTDPNFKVGDKVMFLTVEEKKYVYTNAHQGVYVPKWVTKLTHTVDGISSDGKRVRLKEVWSWTYASNLKKV